MKIISAKSVANMSKGSNYNNDIGNMKIVVRYYDNIKRDLILYFYDAKCT